VFLLVQIAFYKMNNGTSYCNDSTVQLAVQMYSGIMRSWDCSHVIIGATQVAVGMQVTLWKSNVSPSSLTL